MTAIPPNQTLYVRGLNDKIPKLQLKKQLYFLFSQFGKVQGIVAKKTIKERGQAFICFDDLQGAAAAMRTLQGFAIFNKPMTIQYSKTKSNVIKIRDGTLFMRGKRSRDDEDETENKRTKLDDQDHQTLFVSNLPPTASEDAIATLFQQYDGYVELRLVPAKPGIAYVEFASLENAAAALSVLNGYVITPTNTLKIVLHNSE
ncbi:hypothetical protein HDV01_005651 [Terramyces sp. JEL0728]|nr:hypothetical protein HDV01_005651 [Terramyces sp. JEL0728]